MIPFLEFDASGGYQGWWNSTGYEPPVTTPIHNGGTIYHTPLVQTPTTPTTPTINTIVNQITTAAATNVNPLANINPLLALGAIGFLAFAILKR